MKILLDNSALYLPKCGIQRYAECVIEGLIDQLGEESVMWLPVTRLIEFSEISELFSSNLHKHWNVYDRVVSRLFCAVRYRYDKVNQVVKNEPGHGALSPIRLRRELLRVGKDLAKSLFCEQRILRNCLQGHTLYHSLHGFISETVKALGMRYVITIYDIIPLLHPELLEKGDKYCDKRDKKGILALSEDDVVFTISEYSKMDLCNYNARLNPENVHVIHLGAADLFRPTTDPEETERVHRKYGIPTGSEYVLIPLTSDPKKNVPFMVKAFLEMLAAGELSDVKLVLTGKRKALSSLPAELRAGIEQHAGQIILTDFVDDKELAVLLSGALCYCFPSLYEGFGLPVLEAMQCGAPVITSNTTSLPEVAGDAALLVDPTDSEQFKEGVRALCESPRLRTDLSEKALKRAAEFSWEKCVRDMIQAYESYAEV